MVFDIAAGPGGSVVMSVVLDFGNKSLRHVILTYDGSGRMSSVWDTSPYLSWAIAPEENGNVFALANKLLGYNDGKPYPLLNRYDSSGALIGQYLYSSTFQHGHQAINQGNERDIIDPSMSLHGDKLYIYAPVENEFLICTTSGTIVRREPLGKIREQIAAQDKVEFAAMHQVLFVDDSHIFISVEEYPFGRNIVMPGKPYLVNFETGKYSPVTLPVGSHPIGVADGNLVALVPSPTNQPVISTFILPTN